MFSELQQVLIGVGIGIAVAVVVRSFGKSSGPAKPPAPTVPLDAIPAETEAEVRRLIDARRKIEAIKVIRTSTGLGLRDAKRVVDRMSTGASIKQIASGAPALINVSAPLAGDVNTQVKELIRGGNKIEAIKVYRQATGLGLKEAKDQIDRLSQEV